MSEFWHSAWLWTVQSTFAGGAALAFGWLAARRIADPARRLRAMSWSVRASVLAGLLALLPAWWRLPVPGWHDRPASPPFSQAMQNAAPEPTDDACEFFVYIPVDDEPAVPADTGDRIAELPVAPATPEADTRMSLEQPAVPEAPRELLAEIAPIVLVPYLVCVAIVLLRQLIGAVGLARLRRSAHPAGDRIRHLFAEFASETDRPEILVSERLTTPVCFGVFHPTILMPKCLVRDSSDDQLRWVLAHEFDHLKRRDPRTGVWVGLARALYFALPWFWAVRREITMTQEYLADAAAAGSRTADYAAFLVELSSRPGVSRFVRAVPSLAGVRAGHSELYRRVTMLLEPKLGRKSRWGRAWTILAIGGTVSVAVALSGVRLIADDPKSADRKPDGVRTVEVRVKEAKGDGDKPRTGDRLKDGDKKPADAVRDVEVIIVADGTKETAALEKAIVEAAKTGDVEAVKKLVAKLKSVAALPQVGRILPPVPPVPPAPPVPGLAKIRVIREAENDEIRKLEAAMQKLKQAANEVKDQPEARAAFERTIAEYQKKIAEARERALAKLPDQPKDGKGQPFLWKMQAGEAANLDAIKAQMAAMMKMYEKQMAEFKGDDKAMAAMKDAMAKYKESMEALQKQMAQMPKMPQIEGFPNLQPFQFQGVPGIAFDPADGAKPMVWMTRAAAGDKGRLGVMVEAVPSVLVEQLDLPKGQGVIIASVIEGTPAAKAGLKTNDILLQVAGKVVTVEALPKVVAGLKNDESFDVLLIRKGKKETVKNVTIPAPPKTTAKAKVSGKGASSSSMSVSVDNDQFEIKSEQDGLKFDLKGTVGDNDTVAIVIEQDKKKIFEGKGVKNVPSDYRERVQGLLKSVSR